MITHPEKLLFPKDGISKGELLGYYEAIAEVMLPHLRGRPVTLERYPGGIEQKGFIQKNVIKGFPAWLERVEVPKKGGTLHQPLVGDARSLAWLVNQNCVTPHVWASRHPTLHTPDLCLFDLDPSEDDPEVLRSAALAVRELLAELGLPSWLKTSGSKGFHIVVPLAAGTPFEVVWRFAQGVGALLVKRHPECLTQAFLKAERGGRILIDTGRNAYGATFAATYAVRPLPGAPISAPCTWQELENGAVTPRAFRLKDVPERVQRLGDVWAELHARGHALAEPLRELERRLSPQDWTASIAASTRRPKPRRR